MTGPAPEATTGPACEAKRYAPGPCTFDGPRFDVVYVAGGKEVDRHPGCFRHALAEVERHHAAAGMAGCEMAGPLRPATRP